MSTEQNWAALGIDPEVPSIARVYNAFLGGTDNFPADRRVVEGISAAVPEMRTVATLNRAVLGRGVRFLVQQGVEQFLDLGSGLPTAENTHEVARAVNPGARVVYVDKDPLVAAHAGALISDDLTAMVTADLRSAGTVLAAPAVRRLIDFDSPVAVLLVGILHHLHDDEDPRGVVEAYLSAVPSGSYLFVSHFCDSGPEAREAEQKFLSLLGTGRFRTETEIGAFFNGLDLVEPGLVPTPLWHPDEPVAASLQVGDRLIWAGIARKP
ncbi:SAM-dependent methyltransferase [Streptacidiphilus sp. 4-A2]|nr:SAM-dependent methyltransferase [Streptacidiphilus sp. 4-A2]